MSRNPVPFSPYPEKDINILLMGETGVGKTTFINALINYLTYDSLEEALKGEMQILIPSSFSVADSDTHESKTITVGSADDNELCEDNGQSQTQGCKSYVFSIGDRYLRLIDTPGVGDCRGVEHDDKNFDHILNFISHYEHLNAICILLKPNENRLNILFKYGIKELLRHMHVNVKDNVMIVFTYGRSSFFMPGGTSKQLKILLNDLEETTKIHIPFSKENTFTLDNESFRYLAVHKSGCNFFKEHEHYFIDSWKKSVNELKRMLTNILKCGLLAVRDMQSLNDAHQLIRKLTRPIGEVAALIEENIHLAEQHKCKVLSNSTDFTYSLMPQKTAQVVPLDYPRTVCTSEKCSTVIKVKDGMKVDYNIRCHEHCHLKGVEQEVIKNPILKRCRAIDKKTGICKRCNCEWTTHIHVTYDFQKQLTYLEVDNAASVSSSSKEIISRIDERIYELKREEKIICHICGKLALFLRVSSLNPTNEDITEYINHFIQEEKQKLNAGDTNEAVIHRLENLIKEYENEFNLIKSYSVNEIDQNSVPTINDIFVFKCQLFELPITGKYIEEQFESLNFNHTNQVRQREYYVDLPWNAKFSSTMKALEDVLT